MSGPYHVHEGKAFQSEGFLDRAKAFAKGTNTQGTFPFGKFLTEGKMSFKEGTNFDASTVQGMYKVFDSTDQTSTFYRIKIENLGSELMYSKKFKELKARNFFAGGRPKNYDPPVKPTVQGDEEDIDRHEEDY